MKFFYLFSIWLHILAAAVWIGGMAFFALVIVPLTRREEFRSHASGLIHWSGVRFRWVGWICLALLFATGAANLFYQGTGWRELWSAALWQNSHGIVLDFKLLLFVIILVLSALHDFVVGPRATAAENVNPASPQAMLYSRYARWMGRLNLLLALSAVALGIMLVRGFTW